MAINGYKDLIVYQKAYELALDIHNLTLSYPKFEQYELANQLRRASKSIAMNIAEGYGRKARASLADFKHFLIIALGSNDEVMVQLDFSKDLEYITQDQYLSLKSTNQEIGKMLSSMLKTWT